MQQYGTDSYRLPVHAILTRCQSLLQVNGKKTKLPCRAVRICQTRVHQIPPPPKKKKILPSPYSLSHLFHLVVNQAYTVVYSLSGMAHGEGVLRFLKGFYYFLAFGSAK